MDGPLKSVVLINDTRVDHHHGCSRVVAAINHLVEKNGMTLVAASPAHADWRNDEALARRLESASLVIVNGEGTIHHDRPAGRTLLAMGSHARRIGIPAVMVNCGGEANGAELTDLLSEFQCVSVRDHASARAVRKAGIECSVVPDLSLYLDAPAPQALRAGVGFTDSVLRDVTLALEQLRREVGGCVVPVQFSPPGLGGKWQYFREYIGRADLGHPVRLGQLLRGRLAQFRSQSGTAEEFVTQLGALQLLVSGRFHACTLALLARTPFVAAGTNSGKIRALVEDVGLEPWRVGSPVDSQAVARARDFGWSPAERARIDAYVEAARAKADELFTRIGAMA